MNYRKIALFFLIIVGLLLMPVARGAALPVELERTGDRIDVLIGGKLFGAYYFGPEVPKPYFYPLRSAEGTIVTRGYPMVKNLPGEDRDHPHHRAMYFAHGNINGIDFWGEEALNKGAQTARGRFYASEELPHGRTVFRKLEGVRAGPDSGAIRADFDLVGPDGKTIASETQAYTFRGDDSTRTIDCEFTTRADHGVPVKFVDTKEGTFAIRVVKALDSPPGHMVNSKGGAGEEQIWGKRAEWVDYYGKVDEEEAGIAIFDHPSNPKHPTYWHARGYGLFAVNPFGEHDYYNDKNRDGSITIPVGGSLTLRYRVLVHHGDVNDAKVAEAYERYRAATR